MISDITSSRAFSGNIDNTVAFNSGKTKQDLSDNKSLLVLKKASETPSTSLFVRSAKCFGKILFGIALAPVLVIVEGLVGAAVGIATGYVLTVKNGWRIHPILGCIFAVTSAFAKALCAGGALAVIGICFGIVNSIQMALSLSTEPLVKTIEVLKAYIQEESSAMPEKFLSESW
ncbi:MAG: hypothetical protein KAG53_08575 [Endozoicomonadaceae bacterium]|nr:hypothetical protein [Endozoicomonadaceae bacterium]